MSDLKTLSEAFGTYPEDHPQSLRELLDADPDSITHPLAWFLRSQAVDVKRSSEQHYVNGPKDAFKLLKNGYVLHPWTDKWVSYALSAQRQVINVPHERGGTTSLRFASALIPKFDDLPRLPAGPSRSDKQAAWLVLFGGTPDVLSKPGVARGLATLRRRAPVSDVLFFHRDKESATPPTLWSLVAGVGLSDTGSAGGTEVPFPDLEALSEARRTA